LYHHLWKASGIDFPELLKELIDLAFERHQEKENYSVLLIPAF